MDLTGLSVDIADYITIATLLITVLALFWGIMKGLGLFDGESSGVDYADKYNFYK